MSIFPKIRSITPLSVKRLRVEFVNGEIKIYDCQPLLKETEFGTLMNESFFKCVQVDANGYGVVWDDNIDLSESELWIHGITESV